VLAANVGAGANWLGKTTIAKGGAAYKIGPHDMRAVALDVKDPSTLQAFQFWCTGDQDFATQAFHKSSTQDLGNVKMGLYDSFIPGDVSSGPGKLLVEATSSSHKCTDGWNVIPVKETQVGGTLNNKPLRYWIVMLHTHPWTTSYSPGQHMWARVLKTTTKLAPNLNKTFSVYSNNPNTGVPLAAKLCHAGDSLKCLKSCYTALKMPNWKSPTESCRWLVTVMANDVSYKNKTAPCMQSCSTAVMNNLRKDLQRCQEGYHGFAGDVNALAQQQVTLQVTQKTNKWFTVVQFDTSGIGPRHGLFSFGSGFDKLTGRYTANKAGIYLVNANVRVGMTIPNRKDGVVELGKAAIALNGNPAKGISVSTGGLSGGLLGLYNFMVTGLMQLNVGSTISLHVNMAKDTYYLHHETGFSAVELTTTHAFAAELKKPQTITHQQKIHWKRGSCRGIQVGVLRLKAADGQAECLTWCSHQPTAECCRHDGIFCYAHKTPVIGSGKDLVIAPNAGAVTGNWTELQGFQTSSVAGGGNRRQLQNLTVASYDPKGLFNLGGGFDPTLGRFTAGSDGIFYVSASVRLSGLSYATFVKTTVAVNGKPDPTEMTGLHHRGAEQPGNKVTERHDVAAGIIALKKGDYISTFVQVNTTTPYQVSTETNFFAAQMRSPEAFVVQLKNNIPIQKQAKNWVELHNYRVQNNSAAGTLFTTSMSKVGFPMGFNVASGRYTSGIPGVYWIHTNVRLEAADKGSYINVAVALNGLVTKASDAGVAAVIGETDNRIKDVAAAGLMQLDLGDYVSTWVFMDGDDDYIVQRETRFSGAFIASPKRKVVQCIEPPNKAHNGDTCSKCLAAGASCARCSNIFGFDCGCACITNVCKEVPNIKYGGDTCSDCLFSGASCQQCSKTFGFDCSCACNDRNEWVHWRPDRCFGVYCGSSGFCHEGTCHCKDGFHGSKCILPPGKGITCTNPSKALGTCDWKSDGFTKSPAVKLGSSDTQEQCMAMCRTHAEAQSAIEAACCERKAGKGKADCYYVKGVTTRKASTTMFASTCKLADLHRTLNAYSLRNNDCKDIAPVTQHLVEAVIKLHAQLHNRACVAGYFENEFGICVRELPLVKPIIEVGATTCRGRNPNRRGQPLDCVWLGKISSVPGPTKVETGLSYALNGTSFDSTDAVILLNPFSTRNLHGHNGVPLMSKDNPEGKWTIDTWIKTPLPHTGQYHTLTQGVTGDSQILVAPDQHSQLLTEDYVDNVGSVTTDVGYGSEDPTIATRADCAKCGHDPAVAKSDPKCKQCEKNWFPGRVDSRGEFHAPGMMLVPGTPIPRHNDAPLTQTYFTTNQGYRTGQTQETFDTEVMGGLKASSKFTKSPVWPTQAVQTMGSFRGDSALNQSFPPAKVPPGSPANPLIAGRPYAPPTPPLIVGTKFVKVKGFSQTGLSDVGTGAFTPVARTAVPSTNKKVDRPKRVGKQTYFTQLVQGKKLHMGSYKGMGNDAGSGLPSSFQDTGFDLGDATKAKPGWHRLTVVCDGIISKFYLDGQYKGKGFASKSDIFAAGNQQPRKGRKPGNQRFGVIAGFSVYDQELPLSKLPGTFPAGGGN
jgi:hypothetical protein